MFSEECVRAALNDLVQYHEFEIRVIQYSEEHFGNFVIELVKRDSFKVRFIRDRGQTWCELGCGSDWMQLEDVLEVVGASFEYNQNEDYCQNIKLISSTIYHEFKLLDKALDVNNRADTITKAGQIKQKRVEELLTEFK
ncbi:MAG: hypothetical protein GXX09_12575 [Syntrophomonadaceae bacterium]|nr:hypothetical protein [Syntrophomonadaceae bacterium]